MKKLGLLSVATAVAIAGLSTSAFAKPAEEAIKGVDVSGYVRYRFTNDAGTDNTGATAATKDTTSSAQGHKYKTVLKIKAPVNESVTAKLKLAGENETTDSTGDADPDQTAIKEANFIFSLGGNTIIAGKQGLATPFAAGDDQQGSGVVGLFPMGSSLTLAAGLFDNHDGSSIYKSTLDTAVATGGALAGLATVEDIKGNNITALAALGSAGPVKYGVWYAMVSENEIISGTTGAATAYAGASAGATATNINVAAALGPVNLMVNHASVAYSLNTAAKSAVVALGGKSGSEALTPTQTQIVASTKMSDIGLTFGMVMTGDDGGDVGLGDGDETATFAVEQLNAKDLAGASVMYLGVSGMGGSLEYASGSGVAGLGGKTWSSTAKDTDASEIKLSYGYKMSPNFKISGYHSMLTMETPSTGTKKANNDQTRVEVK